MIRNISISTILAISIYCAPAYANDDLTIQAFGKNSLLEIKQQLKDKAFILLFWSKECGYCFKEMRMLASLKPRHPDLEIVLVSTDDDLDSKAASQYLRQTGLQADEIWAFTKSFNQKIYASVDETWRGELPNTLFMNRQHEFQSIKGEVKASMVENWLKYIRDERS